MTLNPNVQKNVALTMVVSIILSVLPLLFLLTSSYAPNLNCTWTVTAPEGQAVVLNFTTFSLFGNGYYDDKILVYDSKLFHFTK